MNTLFAYAIAQVNATIALNNHHLRWQLARSIAELEDSINDTYHPADTAATAAWVGRAREALATQRATLQQLSELAEPASPFCHIRGID